MSAAQWRPALQRRRFKHDTLVAVDAFSGFGGLTQGIELAGETQAANGSPSVEGVVESSVYLGTATQIIVAISEGVRMTVLVPNADEAERQRLPGGGARVVLNWEPEHMHVVIDKDEEDESDGAGEGTEEVDGE